MGQRTHCEVVHTGCGDLRSRIESEATAGLETRTTCGTAYGLAEVVDTHVVEQHEVRARIEYLVELSQGVDLDLDWKSGPRAPHGLERSAYATSGPRGCP